MEKIVIIDRDLYLNKISDLLNDPVTYIKLHKNPLKSTQQEYNKKIKTVLKKDSDLLNPFLISYLAHLICMVY